MEEKDTKCSVSKDFGKGLGFLLVRLPGATCIKVWGVLSANLTQ